MKKLFYETVRENTLALQRTQDTQRTRFILARTVVFPVMLIVLLHGYDAGSAAELLLGGFLLLLFAVLVARHRKLERMRLLTQAYLAVTAGYLARFTGEWKKLPEDGAGYAKETRPPDRDLHIFGAASLYQYLCAARTQVGRQRLAAALTATPKNLARTRRRQAAVAELLAHPILCLELEARGARLPDGHDTRELAKELAQPLNGSLKLISCIGIVFANAFVFSFLWMLFADGPWSVPLVLFMFNLTVAMAFYPRTQRELAPLGHMARELRLYGRIFHALERAPLRGEAFAAGADAPHDAGGVLGDAAQFCLLHPCERGASLGSALYGVFLALAHAGGCGGGGLAEGLGGGGGASLSCAGGAYACGSHVPAVPCGRIAAS